MYDLKNTICPKSLTRNLFLFFDYTIPILNSLPAQKNNVNNVHLQAKYFPDIKRTFRLKYFSSKKSSSLISAIIERFCIIRSKTKKLSKKISYLLSNK